MNTRLTRVDPFQGLTRWNEAFERFLDGLPGTPAVETGLLAPAIDVAEDATRITVTAELPGMEKKDIDLSVKDGVLVLRGEKRMEEEKGDAKFHRIERRYGAFYRALALPDSVESDKVDATFRNGVLIVTLPKSPETQPKRIGIKD